MRSRRGGANAGTGVGKGSHRSEHSDWSNLQDSSHGITNVDEEEEPVCPLCIELLDETEQRFRPCPCGYRVCLFCYERIKLELNGLCPSCRTPYGTPQTASPPPASSKSRPASPLERQAIAQPKSHQHSQSHSHPSHVHAMGISSSGHTSHLVLTHSPASPSPLPTPAPATTLASIAASPTASKSAAAFGTLSRSSSASNTSVAGQSFAGTTQALPSPLSSSMPPSASIVKPAWNKTTASSAMGSPMASIASISAPTPRAPWACQARPPIANLVFSQEGPVSTAASGGVLAASRPAWSMGSTSGAASWTPNAAATLESVARPGISVSGEAVLGSSGRLTASKVPESQGSAGKVGEPEGSMPVAATSMSTSTSGAFPGLPAAMDQHPSPSLESTIPVSSHQSLLSAHVEKAGATLESAKPGFLGGVPVVMASTLGSSGAVGIVGSRTVTGAQVNPWGSVGSAVRPRSNPGVIGPATASTSQTTMSGADTSNMLFRPMSSRTGHSQANRLQADPTATAPMMGSGGVKGGKSAPGSFGPVGAGRLGRGGGLTLGSNGIAQLQQQLHKFSFLEGWSAEDMQRASALVAAARSAQAQAQGRQEARLQGAGAGPAALAAPSAPVLAGLASPEPTSRIPGGGQGYPTSNRLASGQLNTAEPSQQPAVRQVDSGAETSGERFPERPWQAPSLGAPSGRPPTPGSGSSTPKSGSTSRGGTPSLSRSSSLGAPAGAASMPGSHAANGVPGTASGGLHLSGGPPWGAVGSRGQGSPQPSPPITPGSRPDSPHHPPLPHSTSSGSPFSRSSSLSASAGVFIPQSQALNRSNSHNATAAGSPPGASGGPFKSPTVVPAPASSPSPTSATNLAPHLSQSKSVGPSSQPTLSVPQNASFSTGYGTGLTKNIWGPPGSISSDSSLSPLPISLGSELHNVSSSSSGSLGHFLLSRSLSESHAGTTEGGRVRTPPGFSQPHGVTYRPLDLTASLAGNGHLEGQQSWHSLGGSGRGMLGGGAFPSQPHGPARAPLPYRPPLGPPLVDRGHNSVMTDAEGQVGSSQSPSCNQPFDLKAHAMGLSTPPRNGFQPPYKGFYSGRAHFDVEPRAMPWPRAATSDLANSGSLEVSSDGVGERLQCPICNAFSTSSQEDLDEHLDLCQNTASIID